MKKLRKKKPTVQVGDPFTEKLLLEACLELMAGDSIIAIQDMGAAGLTSSSIEMASKGNLGIEINLNKVPCRETKMSPYEIMLSESQERMLIVLENGKEVFEFHIAHNEGNYFCTSDQLKEIDDNNQVAIYYCNDNGKTDETSNPNGSIKNIAGIFNKEKNVLGMMPHPERMIDKSLSGEDGSLFFKI